MRGEGFRSDLAFASRLESLAADVGRLRRRLAASESEYDQYLVDCIAAHVDSLDAMTQPSAAELFEDFFAVAGDEELAMREALLATDARSTLMRSLLGVRECV